MEPEPAGVRVVGVPHGPMERRFAVAAATLFGIVAVLGFIVQPGYLQAPVNLGGLSSAGAVYTAFGEMAALGNECSPSALIAQI